MNGPRWCARILGNGSALCVCAQGSSKDVKRSRGQVASFLSSSVSNRVHLCSHAVRAHCIANRVKSSSAVLPPARRSEHTVWATVFPQVDCTRCLKLVKRWDPVVMPRLNQCQKFVRVVREELDAIREAGNRKYTKFMARLLTVS